MEPPVVVEGVVKGTGKSTEDADADGDEAEESDGTREKKTAEGTARRKAEPTTVEKSTPRELFEYVEQEGSKGYDIKRYKGLGEMTAEQLWETTMDPERRTLLSVKLEDLAERETIFTTPMGKYEEPSRKVTEHNALHVTTMNIYFARVFPTL